MPIYEYEPLGPDGTPTGQITEHFQHSHEALDSLDGKKVRRVPSTFRTERRFSGTESVSRYYGFNPKEVGEAKETFGDCCRINDSGDVEFDNRSNEQKFSERYEQLDKGA